MCNSNIQYFKSVYMDEYNKNLKKHVSEHQKRTFGGFSEYELNKSNISIFRFISFESLIEILSSGFLSISQTKYWDDSYENHYCKIKVKMGNIYINMLDLEDTFYGQCWTLLNESDALWRIYSYDKKSIRISTTVKKLFDSIINSESFDETRCMGIAVGKVRYINEKTFREFYNKFDKHTLIMNFSKLAMESMFLKRKEFNHEKEIRLIYRQSIAEHANTLDSKIIKVKINPAKLIDSITLDPRIDTRTEIVYKDILSKYGHKQVEKSRLYKMKKIIID